MPPPASQRWQYFTRGIHPNPPKADGRTGGKPHTPEHPCSNPQLFWVQCNFCMAKNGGKFSTSGGAWLKSREEQMLQHLKTCCDESKVVYEEIMASKAARREMNGDNNSSSSNAAATAAAMTITAGTKRDALSPTNKSTKFISGNKKPRASSATATSTEAFSNQQESEGTLFFSGTSKATVPTTTATITSKKLSVELTTKLTPSQLRYWHKVAAIATACHNLDFGFFEDPIILELFHLVRPGMVANGQLPSKHLLAGSGRDDNDNSPTTTNLIERHALEQVTNDMSRIVRSLKRYEGLKAAVVCNHQLVSNNRKENVVSVAATRSKVPPCTLVCGGEMSCRMVPDTTLKQHSLASDSSGTQDDSPSWHRDESAAIDLAATVEAQIWSTAEILGKAVIGDERSLLGLVEPGKGAPTSTTNVTAMSKSIQNQDHEGDTVTTRQSTGLLYIGSCLLTTSYPEKNRRDVTPGTIVKRAHHILAHRWPMICFTSHERLEEQLNLLFKDVVTRLPSEILRDPVEKAYAAIRLFQQLLQSNSSPSSKTKQLRDKLLKGLTETYYVGSEKCKDKAVELLSFDVIVCWSRWDLVQNALASLLRIKTGCQSFESQNSVEQDFPDEFRIFSSESFWEQLKQAEALVRPLVRSSLEFIPEQGMETTDNTQVAPTMADVVRVFFSLQYTWRKNGFREAAAFVEKRWQQYEHPFLILAFVLHPSYTKEARAFLNKQSKEDGLFSVKYLSNAVLGYTVKYLASELAADPPLSITILKRQASEYMERIERGEMNGNTMQMQKDWKEFWSYQTLTPELSKFALFILGIPCIQTTVMDMFQSLAAQCVEIRSDGRGHFDRESTRQEQLKDQLELLKKAANPLYQKWKLKDDQLSTSKNVYVLNPAERLPTETQRVSQGQSEPDASLPALPSTAKSPEATVLDRKIQRKGNRGYDPDSPARERLEEKINSKITTNSIPDFWIAALDQLDDDDVAEIDDEEFHQAGEQKEDAELEGKAKNTSEAPTPLADDDDMPKFTLPGYAKPSAPSRPRSRGNRRTYRPEQINFDFMKDWTDTRDQPLTPMTNSQLRPEERPSKLKNYRANKISLADFFDCHYDKIPDSFHTSLSKFDDDEA